MINNTCSISCSTRDGQDQLLVILKIKIRSPKHCDREDQDHFTFSTHREVVVMRGGGKL